MLTWFLRKMFSMLGTKPAILCFCYYNGGTPTCMRSHSSYKKDLGRFLNFTSFFCKPSTSFWKRYARKQPAKKITNRNLAFKVVYYLLGEDSKFANFDTFCPSLSRLGNLRVTPDTPLHSPKRSIDATRP